MNRSRQDSWTKEEDIILAEIVLENMRQARTQLEAFKQAGETLSRTAAACGFRWNATVRKKHSEAISNIKNNRKQPFENNLKWRERERYSIESAIEMLEKVKENNLHHHHVNVDKNEKLMKHLQNENSRLENEIKRYEEAWTEMKNIWEWIEKKNEH